MTDSAKASEKIAKSAALVSIAVMFSRILGLVREQIFAGLFGAGYAYDAFVVAFRIPNLLRDLFGEGALSAAFVSVFSDYDANRSQEETWLLASNVLCFFTVMLSIIILMGIFFSDEIVMLIASDYRYQEGKAELTAKMTIIMMPFLLFISLAAVVMGILNTKGKFFIPALASSFFNLGSIIGGTSLAFYLPQHGFEPIVGMAYGTLIGGLLQLLIQIPTLRSTGFQFSLRLNIRDSGLMRILALMIPATIGLSATQINIFIGTRFAASCVEGSVSWLNYAFRLVQLPIGLFGVAISIAALPVLARFASRKSYHELKQTFTSSLTMVFCLTIPATLGLIILSEPIIALIFEHGAFTQRDTEATAVALSLYAVGLFAYSANKVIVPVFYAIEASRFPVIASFLAIITNIVMIVLTIDHLQHMAIALSTSATMMINFLFLMSVLHYKLEGYPLGVLAAGIGKIGVAAIVMGLGLLLYSHFWGELAEGSLFMQIIYVGSGIAGAATLYLVVLQKMGLPELALLTSKFREKLLRP